MEVLNSQSKHYIGFIEQNNKNDICIYVGNILKINFDTKKLMETKNWSAVAIELLLFAFPGDLYILLFRRKDKATGELINLDFNALPTDIIGLLEAV